MREIRQSGELTPNDIEGKEAALKSREIELYLSERGIEQAKVAAQNLVREITEQGGGVVKFVSSPTKRAKQTSVVLQQTISEILSKEQINNIRLMNPRDRESLKAAGVIGPLMKRGIDDPVDYWLKNPETLEGKSPSKTAERLYEMIDRLQKMANRLSPGEKIYYIGVTHEVPQAALLNQTSGKTLSDLGGKVKNCEWLKVEMNGRSEEGATIKFRGEEMKIKNLAKEQTAT